MSLKGIESQTLMQRTGEYVKEAANIQKRPEIHQNQLVNQHREEQERFSEQVNRLMAKDDVRIRTEGESRNGPEDYPQQDKKQNKKKKLAAHSIEELPVQPKEKELIRKPEIDIRV